MEQFDIPELGSNQWKEFIKAAKIYASEIESKREANIPYPSEKDACLLCLQPLSPIQNNLISLYWKLLKSEAETELSRTVQKIKDLLKLKTYVIKFDESILLYDQIYLTDAQLATRWKKIVEEIDIVRQNVIGNLSTCTKDLPCLPLKYSTDEFKNIEEKIKSAITGLINQNRAEELALLEKEILLLTDKKRVKRLIEQVLLL